jgi:hypothetical protein
MTFNPLNPEKAIAEKVIPGKVSPESILTEIFFAFTLKP